jgi:hypothetical protein
MSNQQVAAERMSAFDKEMNSFIQREWPFMKDIAARAAREREIEAKHGYQHGWISVNGEGFNHEKAFPDKFFPRFPADQGLSD